MSLRHLIPAAPAGRVAALALSIVLSTMLVATSAAALPPAEDTPLPPATSGPQTPDEQPTDRFIVKFAPGVSAAADGLEQREDTYAAAADETAAVTEVDEVRETALGATVITTDEVLGADEADSFLDSLNAMPEVEYAERDGRSYPSTLPDDTHFNRQWNLQTSATGINMAGAWDISRGKDTVVAVVDTGIAQHSDLSPKVLPGYDMIWTDSDGRRAKNGTKYPGTANDGGGRDPNPADPGDWAVFDQCETGSEAEDSSWHGTHVAGTIAAVTGNRKGVAGVAPDASILPVRVLGTCGGYNSDIADGIIWATGGAVPQAPKPTRRADVINLSLGGSGTCPRMFQDAIDRAVGRGIPVVVASGNEGEDVAGHSPANCRNVIVVGATTTSGDDAWYSNYGRNVDLMAPGGDEDGAILSTSNAGTKGPAAESYALDAGTSMATPHVSGVIALMLARNPTLTPAAVESLLKAKARPMGCAAEYPCGAGLLDAAASLKATPLPLTPATPAIHGTPGVGRTLTAVPGIWGPAPVALAYRWYRSGSPIPGATKKSYVLAGGDAGKRITVAVTGSKKGYSSLKKASAPTGAISAGKLTSKVPKVGGTARVASTLTAVPGTWGPRPVTLSYRWYRSGKPIPGATKKAYKLVGTDAGKTIKLAVTGTRTGYSPSRQVSAPTRAVAKGKLTTTAPKITGKARVGSTVSISMGKWGPSPVSVKYSWYRSGKPIPGATKKTHKLVNADAGKTIKVKVTGKKTGYTAVVRTSGSSAKVLR